MIVDLRVDWRSESALPADALAAQRRRIEAAQDELIGALGLHGSLVRRLTETGQVVVAVDDEGLRALNAHPLTTRSQEDRTDPPSAPGSAAGVAPTPTAAVTPSSTAAPDRTTMPPNASATTAPAAASLAPTTAPTTVAPGARRLAVVTLAVEWAPESGLSGAALSQQRARVESAQDEVVAALGEHGVLTTRLTPTAQLAVSTDEAGLALLATHPKVRSVEATRPDASNTSS